MRAFLYRIILSTFVFLFLLCQPDKAQIIHNSENDMRMIQEQVDRFVLAYRESLDLDSALAGIGSTATVSQLRKNDFFKDFRFAPNLINTSDDKSLCEAYEAIMNNYFLGALYLATTGAKTLPSDVQKVASESKIGNIFAVLDSDNGRDNETPIVNTENDLIEFKELQHKLAISIKSHLPRSPFEVPALKQKFAKDSDERRPRISYYLDDGKNRPVFVVQRGFFTTYWIKEDERMKILLFGIGN